MKFAYFDCFSGAAGDMIIGSLLNAGLSFETLKVELQKIELSGYKLTIREVKKNHIAGTKFDVEIIGKQPRRTPKEIIELIASSEFDDEVKLQSIAIFNRLTGAESKAHGELFEDVHFHEVGGADAIIDVCGAVIGLKLMGIEKVYCSPLSLGSGRVETEHGVMPIPAPATAELVKDSPVRLTTIESELTTPTGAAILTTLADFDVPAILEPIEIGYGAGSRDLPELPNLLRVIISESGTEFDRDTVTVLETNLDRASPEILGGIFEELISAGALDVFITPAVMKKNRPGQILTVLCEEKCTDKLAKIIFSRGITLGIRIGTKPRIKLFREETTVSTSGGDVSVKIGLLDEKDIIFPEYENMVKAMKNANKSYDDIFFEILSGLRKET